MFNPTHHIIIIQCCFNVVFVVSYLLEMGRDLILWKPQEITSNVVLGQYCRTYHNILTQSNEFSVANILSIMAVEKNNTMQAKESFKGFLKYYVKMNVG
jgi:hypothetical protein